MVGGSYHTPFTYQHGTYYPTNLDDRSLHFMSLNRTADKDKNQEHLEVQKPNSSGHCSSGGTTSRASSSVDVTMPSDDFGEDKPNENIENVDERYVLSIYYILIS